MTIVPHNKTAMIYNMKCEVKKKTDCKSHTQEDCKIIDYTETEQRPEKVCAYEQTRFPKQHLQHHKKCFVPKKLFIKSKDN